MCTGVLAAPCPIETHYAQQITVDILCEIFHFSRPTLFSRFKQEHGMGITEYVNSLRIEMSKKFLERYSVSETAERVGIEDPNYFSRMFKKNTGLTPSQYARLARKQTSELTSEP
ncbi:MAG: helix-turn-helix domain-containing protein [Candidatus Gallimonas sp.]